MLVKFINRNQIEYPTNPIYIGDVVVSNPKPDFLKKLGFKELQKEPYPMDEQEELFNYSPYYIEEKDKIIQKWEKNEIAK